MQPDHTGCGGDFQLCRIGDAGCDQPVVSDNQLLEKYGQAGVKELENGSFRFYSEVKSARTQGEMAGARLVREWDPSSGKTRPWYETVDHAGNVRSVAPKPVVEEKNHRIFDADGNYKGRR
ncbi:hypothetical protein AB6825_12580 [Serratia proteamaculans]|uniref:hypothetical protein n=1 Tax=Serratia proteamaculans TaxID=28151 RepID=UPI0039BE7F69